MDMMPNIFLTLTSICLIITSISLVITTNRYRFLKIHSEVIEEDNKKLRKEKEENINYIDLYEIKYKENIKSENKIKEIENILKAVVYKFSDNEIKISTKDINEAERGHIYLDHSYMESGKRIKLLFDENYLKKEKI